MNNIITNKHTSAPSTSSSVVLIRSSPVTDTHRAYRGHTQGMNEWHTRIIV